MLQRKQICLGLAVSACLAFASSAANAASFTVESWTLGHAVTSTLGGETRTTGSAQLDVVLDGVAGTSFCVDLEQSIGQSTYDGVIFDPAVAEATFARSYVASAVLANAWSGKMEGLASASGAGVTVKDAVTGMQVKIWRILYGSDITIDDSQFDAGTLAVIDFLSAQAPEGYGDSKVIVFPRNQDQVFTPGSPMPEPTAFLAFGAGSLVMGGAVRRRKRA